MEIKLVEPQKVAPKKGTVLVLPFFSGGKIRIDNKEIAGEAEKFTNICHSLKEGDFRLIFFEKGPIIFFNAGKEERWNQRKFLLNLKKIVRHVKENKIKKAVMFLEIIFPRNVEKNNLIRQIPENILLADYEFNRYKEKPEEGWFEMESIEISCRNISKYQKDFFQGQIIGKAVNFARDLSNTPGGEMTPERLAKAASEAVKKLKNIKVEVFDEKELKELGMGGILGVAQGSSQKPKLIILKYSGGNQNQKIDLVFVGKGITFDTGGLQIKPSEAMLQMHLDMSGGAAVLAAMIAIAQFKLSLNIIALIPAVESMPSGHALRPGDILKAYNGKTIEVLNTDAEGRIILADALSYAAKNFKPKLIVDVATLTGAAAVALGQRAVGLFTNLPDLSEIESKFRQIGEDSGDYVWPLPCWEEYEEEIKGTFGDIANMGKTRYGGATTAALFLKNFVANIPWIHLDIHPTVVSIENQGLAKGATGSGARYLVRIAQDFNKIKMNL